MTVSLNPFVEIDNPDGIGHRWRGTLRPESPAQAAFFADYGRYVAEMAALAQAGRADRLYVGSELRGLATDPGALPRWRQVIARARAGFGGRLSYAANHDSYARVPFWDRLDEIGIDAYFRLVPRAEAEGAGRPSAARLEAAWRQVLAKVEAFSRATRRPVVFSEWGCVPRDGTTASPSCWNPSETPDPAEQEAACAALLAAARDQGNWLVGVQLWHWRMPGGDSAYAVGPGSEVARLAATAREAKEDVRP
jgi:hypothetical protein